MRFKKAGKAILEEISTGLSGRSDNSSDPPTGTASTGSAGQGPQVQTPQVQTAQSQSSQGHQDWRKRVSTTVSRPSQAHPVGGSIDRFLLFPPFLRDLAGGPSYVRLPPPRRRQDTNASTGDNNTNGRSGSPVASGSGQIPGGVRTSLSKLSHQLTLDQANSQVDSPPNAQPTRKASTDSIQSVRSAVKVSPSSPITYARFVDIRFSRLQ